MTRLRYILPLLLIGALAFAAAAHQPREVGDPSGPVTIDEPEVSQAFYAELRGEADEYLIMSEEPFQLYVGLSVPDLPDAETDFRFAVTSGGRTVAEYDGIGFDWERMYEPFAGDDYLGGPEFSSRVPAGEYVIIVSSPDDYGKYVLAVGEGEVWHFDDIVQALTVVPQLKSDYFGKSRASFALSVFGAVQLAVLLAIGFLAGLVWRKAVRYFGRKAEGVRPHGAKNIGRADRLIRLTLALLLLVSGIWFWQPVLLAAAGFVLYEVLSGWCAVYAAIGRNTCPIS